MTSADRGSGHRASVGARRKRRQAERLAEERAERRGRPGPADVPMDERVSAFAVAHRLPRSPAVDQTIRSALMLADLTDAMYLAVLEGGEERLASAAVSATKTMMGLYASLGLPGDVDPDAAEWSARLPG